MGLFDKLTQGLSRTAERLAQRFDEIVRRADAPERQADGVDVDEAVMASVAPPASATPFTKKG